MLPTKENIEKQFFKKYVGNETFPKRISDPILADDILDFILQIQKDTIEAIRLKEKKGVNKHGGRCVCRHCLIHNMHEQKQSLIKKLL